MSSIFVNGIVSHRDHLPKIQLSGEDGRILCQMDAEDAVKLAMDILKMSEATKVDAAIWKWASATMDDKAEEFGTHLMVSFRDFRAELEEDSRKRQNGGNPK